MADTPNQPQKSGGTGLDTNVASGLCYLCGWVTGLVFLLIDKDNKEVKFHAWQSIFLSVFAMVLYIPLWILAQIPFMFFILPMIYALIYLGFFVLVIICMVKAFQGGRFKVPVIYDLAEKQANK